MTEANVFVRYLGYRNLRDGGRGFDFSCIRAAEKPLLITIEASPAVFQGPDRIALQEAAGICYQALKWRLQTGFESMSTNFSLTAADVAQHRQTTKPNNRH
jgi:hypothetical protein